MIILVAKATESYKQWMKLLQDMTGAVSDDIGKEYVANSCIAHYCLHYSINILPCLEELHWLDVPDRVIFKLAVIVHRCLNGRAPPYLLDYCAPVASADRRHLRSTNCQLLAVPRYRLNTYGRRAFSVASPTVWNSLPNFIRNPTISLDCFRRLLKTHLFARY